MTWRMLRSLVGDRTVRVLVLAGAAVGAGTAEAGVLALVAQVAATMVGGADDVTLSIGPVLATVSVASGLAAAAVLALLRLCLQVLIGWLPATIAADVRARLRRELYATYSATSWRVQADEPEGHLQEVMTNQVSRATDAVLQLAVLLSAGVMFTVLAVSACVVSVPVAVAVLVTPLVLFLLMRPLTRWGRSSARAVVDADMRHATAISEAVRLNEEAQVFGTADAHRRRVEALIEDGRRAFFRMHIAGRLGQSTYQSVALLVVIGGLAVLHALDAGNVADLGAAVLMLVRSMSYFQQAQGAYHYVLHAVPSLEQMAAITARCLDAAPTDGGCPLPAVSTLGMHGVSFSYRSGRRILSDVSFEIAAGSAVGILGPSGAGKSTLLQILLRLREPEAGTYLVNGRPADDFARADWQRLVAYVPQEPRLMHASVADNIRYLRDLDDGAVRRAARQAHIDHDIETWPQGYDTVIGQRADAVSGGQRQRICLARALAASPQVLVLDEPTSALDLASEQAIQASLAELHGHLTVIIVAHRRSLLSVCDSVLHIDEGRLVQSGPMDRALARDPA